MTLVTNGPANFVVYRWTFADATARAALSAVPADVGQFAWQQDDDTIWLLTDDSPLTWVQVGGGSVASLDDVGDVNAPTPANGDVLTWDSTPGEWVATPPGAGGLALIQRQTLGSPAASVTFSSIPGTYGGLMLDWQGRVVENAIVVLNLRFNGDAGANYDQHFATLPAGAGASSPAQTSIRIGSIGGGSSQTAGRANAGRVTIPNYAGAVFHKSVLFDAQRWDTGNSERELGSGDWRNTAAITSITIFPGSGTFLADSVFSLYGLA